MSKSLLFDKFFKQQQNWFIVDRDGIILEFGANFKRVFPKVEDGCDLRNLLNFDSNKAIFEVLESQLEFNEKIVRINIDETKTLKCSWCRNDDVFLVTFNPVLNTRVSVSDYNLSTSDFLTHEQILEYIFLLQTTNASAEDAKKLISKLSQSRNEILKTKEFYENILSELPVEMGVFNLKQEYLFVNKTGIRDKEMRSFMIGKTDFDYCEKRGLDPSFARNRKKKFDEALKKRDKVDWIDDFFNSNAKKRAVIRRTYYPILNDENEVIVVIGYGVDITQEIIKEESRSESEKKYRSLFEENLAGVFVTNEKGNFIEINDAYARVYGYENKTALIKDNSRNFYVSSEDRETYLKLLKDNLFVENYQLEQKNKFGDSLFVSVNSRYQPSTQTIFGTLIDQTDLIKKSNELEVTNKRIVDILSYIDQSSDAIMVTDESGLFRYVNKTAKTRYGIEEVDSVDTFVWDIQTQPFSKESLQLYFDELELAPSRSQRTVHKNIKTNKKIPVELNVTLYHSGTGERFLVASSRDISYTLEKEKEIIEINKELESRVKQEIQKNAQLSSSITKQEKFSIIGEIAAGISHDLRTPLTTMKLGSSNIESLVKKLFEIICYKLSQEEIVLGFDIFNRLDKSRELFIGGIKQMKENKTTLNYLSEWNTERSEDNLIAISRALTKAKIYSENTECIAQIMGTDNPIDLCELVYILQAIEVFNNGIENSAKKSLEVLANLNSFIKADLKSKEGVNLSASINSALDVLKFVKPPNIEITTNLDSKIEMLAYPSQLFQIWLNIIRNAFEAIGDQQNGQIVISLHQTNGKAIIEIMNNGPKVPEEIVKNIFNPFYTTKASAGGSGLGLSVVKKAIESHYGKITVLNTENNVKFVINLKLDL